MKKYEKDNELIAEFMGLMSFEDSRYGTLWPSPLKAKTPATCFSLCYHESWDWLMLVVEKIDKMSDYLLNQVGPGNDAIRNFFTLYITADIDKVYKAVVEFIKWHNSQSK